MGGKPGEPRTGAEPRERKPHEPGAANLEFLSGGLSHLFLTRDPLAPKQNYLGVGSLEDKFVRNLGQLERASASKPRAHAARRR